MRDILPFFVDELLKIAEPSSYLQDFAAGIDPFGAWTSDYGAAAEKAKLTESEHQNKRLLGTAGGVVGGALLVPSSIGGIVGAGKGFATGKGGLRGRLAEAGKGFMEGVAKPIKAPVEAIRARRAIAESARTGQLSAEQAHRISALGKYTPLSEVTKVKSMTPAGGMKSVDTLPSMLLQAKAGRPVQLGESGKNIMQALHRESAAPVGQALTGMGLGGAVGATGAYVQYGKGRQSRQDFEQELNANKAGG